MKVSLNWIREYITLPEKLSIEQLAYDLTMRTVEVEGWENPALRMQKVVVGEILSVEPHPDADRLRVCQVNVGQDKNLQIVCGGSNLSPGMKVAVAVPGSKVIWHGQGDPVEIKVGKLRGVLSEGMICASEELTLGTLFPAKDDHEIMDLTEFPGAKAGMEISELLQLDDWILEIDNKSMTNRPDLWGHYGIARELSAIYHLELKPLPVFHKADSLPTVPIDIQASRECPRYTATIFSGVSNGESPFPLKVRLWLLDHSSHGLLVDCSNLTMLATGQPNHAFDRRQMEGTLIVRKAENGEKLLILDDQELTLSEEDLVIATEKEAVGLAGIMGGKTQSIVSDTKEMFFEVANFDPRVIRRMSQRYELRTDAEARFEKGLDIPRVQQALGVMQAMLESYCSDTQVIAYAEAGESEVPTITVPLSLRRLKANLGMALSTQEIRTLLEPLGFQVREPNAGRQTVAETCCGKEDAGNSDTILEVQVPSWRATGDVSISADLVEEIARMIGYENFQKSSATIELKKAVQSPQADLERKVREYLSTRCGLQEVFTTPWVEESLLHLAGFPNDRTLELMDPPAPEQRYLRQSLVPGLIGATVSNARYYENFGIYELTQVFEKFLPGEAPEELGFQDDQTLPKQTMSLGIALYGAFPWILFRRLKGIVESLPRFCVCQPLKFSEIEKKPWCDAKTWLTIETESGQPVGTLGLLSVAAKKDRGFKKGDVALLELNLSALKPLESRENHFRELPQYPTVDMDFSVLADDGVRWSAFVEELAKRVENLELVDEYRGKQIPEGKKSLTLRVTMGKPDGTLSAEEIEEKRSSLIKRMTKKLGADVRQS